MKQFGCPEKPFSGFAENVPKLRGAINAPRIKQRGSIMWALIMSLVYQQSCKNYLTGIEAVQWDVA
jgi:hypothetical protein